MNKKKILWLSGVGIFLIAVLAFVGIWSWKFITTESEVALQIKQIGISILILVIAWIVFRLISLIFIDPINEKRERALPRIIKDIIIAVIFLAAIAVIVTQVYNKSILSLGVLSISTWTCAGLAAKDMIADCLYSISTDIQGNFEVGDWVQFPDGAIGQILTLKLGGVSLLMPNDTVLFISNVALNTTPMINLCRPTKDYFLGVSVVLDHDVPVDRARRILQAAACSSPGVFNNDASVFAQGVQSNGVVYDIFFRIPHRGVWLESRHQLVSSVTKHLHKFGLKVSQITGEINVRALENTSEIHFNDSFVTNPLETLKMSKLLDHCSEDLQEEFSKRMKLRQFKKKETIVKAGDDGETMFIIAEGIVDVQLDLSGQIENKEEQEKQTHRIACLVDGEYFGEMALLKGEKRTADVIARTDVVLYEIDRETIKTFIEQYPNFAEKLSLSLLARDSMNIETMANAVERKAKEEKAISEFVQACKKFLWSN